MVAIHFLFVIVIQISMSVQIIMEDVIKHVPILLGAIDAAVKVVTCSTKMAIAAMVSVISSLYKLISVHVSTPTAECPYIVVLFQCNCLALGYNKQST